MTPGRDETRPARRAKAGRIKRLVNRRFGKSAAGRVGTAAVLAALGTLVRNHPAIAMEMAAAGLKKAGKTGVSELKAAFSSADDPRS